MPDEGVHAGKQKLKAMNNEIMKRVEARGGLDRGMACMMFNSPLPGILITIFPNGGQYTCTLAAAPADLAIVPGGSERFVKRRGLALPRQLRQISR